MEKKRDKRPIIIVVLIIVLGVVIYFYNATGNESVVGQQTTLLENSSSSTTTSDANVEVKTIQNTISTSGEIKTALDEKLNLHATYYYEELYFEEGDSVLKGENLLKYTNDTYLVAPYNLVISSVNVPERNGQCTNSNYIEVYSTDTLQMSLSVAEDELNKLSVGLEVSIVPTIDSSKTYMGYVTSISNSGTYSSRGTTYSVLVMFDNDDDLKVGMSAKADIVLEKAEDVLVVPSEAVQSQNDEKYVVVVENGNTKNVTVETGISNDAYTEIKSGLEQGQTIQITTNIKTTTNSNYIKIRN